MDVATSTFKIKLLKALATTKTPSPSPPKVVLKSSWIISDPDLGPVYMEWGTPV